MITSLVKTGVMTVLRAAMGSSEGKSAGITENTLQAVEAYMTRDERDLEQVAGSIEQARQHDKATYGDTISGQIVDFFRGMVRPTITYVAFAWYIYARTHDIPLSQEDYMIIGGVAGFWFAGRLLGKDMANIVKK